MTHFKTNIWVLELIQPLVNDYFFPYIFYAPTPPKKKKLKYTKCLQWLSNKMLVYFNYKRINECDKLVSHKDLFLNYFNIPNLHNWKHNYVTQHTVAVHINKK